MKKLLVYLRDYKKEVVFAPLFKLLEASFELIVPLVVAAIIDYGIANSDKGYIFKMCGVLVLLAIVTACLTFALEYERVIKTLETSHFTHSHRTISRVMNEIVWHGANGRTLS